MIIGCSIFLGAVGLAVAGSLTFWPVTHGYDFYIPIVLFLAGYLGMMLLWWVFIYCYGVVVSKLKPAKKVNKFTRFLLCDAMHYIDRLARVRVKINGKEKLPTKERFLLVQNHASRFDPMVVNGYLQKYDIAFITKPSNFKIPLAKRLMPRLFYQAIVREDPMQSLGVMKNSIELIESNVTSIGVYPEGTRHKDGQVGEFHEGVFNICLKARCPLVVCTTVNTNMIHSNFPLKRTHVYLDIIKVIPYEQMEGKTAKALSDEVREMMKVNLDRYH